MANAILNFNFDFLHPSLRECATKKCFFMHQVSQVLYQPPSLPPKKIRLSVNFLPKKKKKQEYECHFWTKDISVCDKIPPFLNTFLSHILFWKSCKFILVRSVRVSLYLFFCLSHNHFLSYMYFSKKHFHFLSYMYWARSQSKNNVFPCLVNFHFLSHMYFSNKHFHFLSYMFFSVYQTITFTFSESLLTFL